MSAYGADNASVNCGSKILTVTSDIFVLNIVTESAGVSNSLSEVYPAAKQAPPVRSTDGHSPAGRSYLGSETQSKKNFFQV